MRTLRLKARFGIRVEELVVIELEPVKRARAGAFNDSGEITLRLGREREKSPVKRYLYAAAAGRPDPEVNAPGRKDGCQAETSGARSLARAKFPLRPKPVVFGRALISALAFKPVAVGQPRNGLLDWFLRISMSIGFRCGFE